MGIIKSREELLPVTCAILKEADREAFFAKIRKERGGRPESLAKLLGVPQAVISDWTSGSSNIPYHTLQKLAHEFSVELPPIAELRRESLPVIMSPSPMIPPPPILRSRTKERGHVHEKTRQPRREPRRQAAERKKAKGPSPSRAPRPPRPAKEAPAKKGLPEFSADLAYWVGTLLAGAAPRENAVVFSADRRIGQNFAAIWARQTRKLLGHSAQLSAKDEGRVQEASLPTAGIEEFLSRLGFGAQAPGLPRWVWSNPEWKKACLRGLMDAAGHFQRTPALILGLPQPLGRAAAKILDTLGLPSQPGSGDQLEIQGRENVQKYFEAVGTSNPKLRDQLQSYLGRPRASGEPVETDPSPEASSKQPAAASGAADAPAVEPEHAPRPAFRPRKTVFRGRPKHS